jgi:aryl-alcohol dehydrogenase-like predicted oxidoreductase
VLTGKYVDGRVPAGSRGAGDGVKFMRNWLLPEEMAKVLVLESVARRRGETAAQVALAWVLRDPVVSSAIIGATTAEQVRENASASGVALTLSEIEELERAFVPTGVVP